MIKSCKFTKLFFTYFVLTIFFSDVSFAGNVLNENVDEKNNIIENENEIKQQLNDYKTVSKWIIDNQDNFKQVLKDTAKKSSTKWVISSIGDNKNEINKTKYIEKDNHQESIYHSVKEKETVYSISRIYDISPKTIIDLNNLSKDGSIYVGQKLLIKQADNIVSISPLDNNIEDSTFENEAFVYPQYKYYQVLKGDTIYSISKAVNMTPEELIKFNNLDKIDLYPGMILKIHANYDNINNINKFEWPLIGRLLISFGPQKTGMVSEGINIMAKKGAPVKSVADGVVIYIGNGVKALGNIVLIQHQMGWVSVYGYLNEIIVKKGDEVKRSQIIGKVGKPVNVKIPQLHFELRENITPKDPLEYLNSYT